MKNLLIYCSIITYMLTSIPSYSFSLNNTQNAEISKIENDLYGFDYKKEDLKDRIERLELSVYGKVQQGDLVNRTKKLAADIMAEQIGQELPPTEDTFRYAEELADNTVSYPIVDEIEQELFNQTYKNRDFHTRIVTIERKLFNKIYDVEDYSTRMDRIKATVMPEKIAKNSEQEYTDYNENDLNSNDIGGLETNYYSTRPYGQRNYTQPYANYGDDFRRSNINNLNPDELSQLEYETFGTEFSNEDNKSRLKRLKSANKAKKSSARYDSQKFQQRMSTAMEIGAMILMILAMVL